jgi:choline dehydrogenase-like flavoprotein
MQADYVIIGAGSAGCVLANRLTEDPTTRVILIEAGGRDWNPLIHIPVGYMKLLDHKRLTWGFKAEADSGTNGRAIAYPRGRVLGGSSSINGLIYIRSQPEDYDHWAQLGNRGWGRADGASRGRYERAGRRRSTAQRQPLRHRAMQPAARSRAAPPSRWRCGQDRHRSPRCCGSPVAARLRRGRIARRWLSRLVWTCAWVDCRI